MINGDVFPRKKAMSDNYFSTPNLAHFSPASPIHRAGSEKGHCRYGIRVALVRRGGGDYLKYQCLYLYNIPNRG